MQKFRSIESEAELLQREVGSINRMGGAGYIYRDADENWRAVDLQTKYDRLVTRTERWIQHGTVPPEEVFEALEGAADLLFGRNGERTRAVQQLAIDAGHIDWYLYLALAYVAHQHLLEAQDVLRNFIEHYHSRTTDGRERQTAYELVESFWRERDYPLLAARLFEQYAEYDEALYRRIAAIYVRAHDYETAELAFQKAIARNDVEPLDLILYANLLLTAGRYDEVVAVVDQAADAVDVIDVYVDYVNLVFRLAETQIELYRQLAKRAKVQGQPDFALGYLFLEVSAQERGLIIRELRRLYDRTVRFLDDDRVEEAETLLADALDAGQPWVSELYEALLTRHSAPSRKGLRSRLPSARRERRAIGSMIETAEALAQDRVQREEAAGVDVSFLHLPIVPLVSTGGRTADLAFTADGEAVSDSTPLAELLPVDNCLTELIIE